MMGIGRTSWGDGIPTTAWKRSSPRKTKRLIGLGVPETSSKSTSTGRANALLN